MAERGGVRAAPNIDATFDACKLVGSNFERCTFGALKVTGGDWSFVGCPGADLRGTTFLGVRMREADLTGVRTEASTLRDVDLSGAWAAVRQSCWLRLARIGSVHDRPNDDRPSRRVDRLGTGGATGYVARAGRPDLLRIGGLHFVHPMDWTSRAIASASVARWDHDSRRGFTSPGWNRRVGQPHNHGESDRAQHVVGRSQ